MQIKTTTKLNKQQPNKQAQNNKRKHKNNSKIIQTIQT